MTIGDALHSLVRLGDALLQQRGAQARAKRAQEARSKALELALGTLVESKNTNYGRPIVSSEVIKTAESYTRFIQTGEK